MSLFKQFQSVLIINLAARSDRRRETRAQLRKAGLPEERYEFWQASTFTSPDLFASTGARGCFHSHLGALREAHARDHSLLILEDDCNFTAAMADYELPTDGDIFYGGYQAADPDNMHASDIIGSHCMGFRATVVGPLIAYLERYLSPDFLGDAQAMGEASYDNDIRPGIDGAYVWFRRAHPQFTTVFADPQIAYQRASRTDIGHQALVDRAPGLRQLAGGARQFRRWLTSQ